MSNLVKTQFDATQPLRFYLESNNLIEFCKIILSYLKTPFEATQPLRFELNRYAWTEYKKFLPNSSYCHSNIKQGTFQNIEMFLVYLWVFLVI